MQIPVGLKPGLTGAAVGAILLSIVGFSQLGWKSASTAERMAQDRADAAVVTAMVPYCVLKAQHDPDQGTLVKFQAEQSSYSRTDLVSRAGWATLGDGKFPDSALARACSDKLHDLKPA